MDALMPLSKIDYFFILGNYEICLSGMYPLKRKKNFILDNGRVLHLNVQLPCILFNLCYCVSTAILALGNFQNTLVKH